MQIGRVAPEHPVRCHGDENIQIACAATLGTGLAFAGKADAGAVGQRDGDFERFFLLHATAAAAGLAWIFDHLTSAIAGGTGPFDGEEALLRAYLSAPLAHAAGRRMRSLAAPNPLQSSQVTAVGTRIGFHVPGKRPPGWLHVVAEIGAPRGTGSAAITGLAPAAHEIANISSKMSASRRRPRRRVRRLQVRRGKMM